MAVVGRKMLDDDDYMVIWARFFGIDIPLLGNVYVQLKRTGTVLRTSSGEKRDLLALLGNCRASVRLHWPTIDNLYSKGSPVPSLLAGSRRGLPF
jgi:hypothetical protein